MRLAAFRRTRYGPRTLLGCAALVLPVLTSAQAEESSVACKLLQPAELESALGGKAGKFSGESAVCTGQVGMLKVLVRSARRQREDGGALERKSLEMARKMGALVEVKTEGELTCMTAIPPASLAQMGFNTTCSILREGTVVAVEVTAPSRGTMASMDAVRTLVKKAFARRAEVK